MFSSSFWEDIFIFFSFSFKYLSNWLSLKASTRLTPAAIADWLTTLNFPTSLVFLTCVPPHNSVEKYLLPSSPINTTLTSSPYFSPNKAKAPCSMPSLGVINLVITSLLLSTIWLTILLILSNSLSDIDFIWLKSNLSLSGATREPFCITCLPKVLLRDSWRRCVAEWYALILFLRSKSIFNSTLSFKLSLPFFILPKWMNKSPNFFCTSLTTKLLSPHLIVPVSPSCPPDSP